MGGSGSSGGWPSQVSQRRTAGSASAGSVGAGGMAGQDGGQLAPEPGVEHRSGAAGHPGGPHLPGGGMEERQELGGAAPRVLVGLALGVALLLPGGPRLRDGLVRPRLVLAPDRDPRRLGLVVCPRYAPLLPSVCGPTTCTGPSLRWRTAVPVGHQARLSW